MSLHNQFIRKATLTIGNSSEKLDLSALQFSFQIKQADIENYQAASIRVYNVDQKTTGAQIKQNEYSRVKLQAGYEQGNYGVIFDGEVIQMKWGRESNVSTYLDILAGEGYSANQAVVNTTLAAGSDALDAAAAAAQTTGKAIKSYNYNPAAKLPRGQVLYGMSRDVLHTAAATAGFSYFYNGDKIVFVPLESAIPGNPTLMNASTGMIGWPEQTQEGIRVKCLLNPLLDVASQIKIDNASIQLAPASASYTFIQGLLPPKDYDGLYRIILIEHHGDTRGNDWYSDIVCVSVNNDTGLSSLFMKGQA